MTIQHFVEHALLAQPEDKQTNRRHYVLETDAVPLLLDVLAQAIALQANRHFEDADPYLAQLSKVTLERVVFRAAYIFDDIFMMGPGIIKSESFDFLSLLFQLKSESAKRHFLKILSHALEEDMIKVPVTPKVRVAVQIYAFECLAQLRHKSVEAPIIMEELGEMFKQNDTPAMCCRVRRWHQRDLLQ